MSVRIPAGFPPHIFLLVFLLSLLSCVSTDPAPASPSQGSDVRRKEKLLNVFNIVRFPNDGCNTTQDTYGVCYTATECKSKGGLSKGTCASGFGVCCAFSLTCGSSTSLNNTYLVSSTSDTSPCVYTVCRSSADICQLRLGFSTFDIAQPSTQNVDTNPVGRSQCQSAQFSASNAGPAAPVLCGTNTGYHMILEAKETCNTVTFSWTSASTVTRTWDIHVMQIPCTASWKAPSGCLQYFTGTTGTVYSYNYQGTKHLASQNYNNCIRTESGYCSIAFAATDFRLSGDTTPRTALSGDSCTADYVIIPGAGSTTSVNPSFDRWCGGYLNPTAASTAEGTIYTKRMPFQIGVVFDGVEIDPSFPTLENSVGFAITYSQTSC